MCDMKSVSRWEDGQTRLYTWWNIIVLGENISFTLQYSKVATKNVTLKYYIKYVTVGWGGYSVNREKKIFSVLFRFRKKNHKKLIQSMT